MSVLLQVDADGGVTFGVKAQAGARSNAVRGEHAGLLKVAVTEAPERGKANEAIGRVLCGALGLRPAQLSLTAGPADSRKRFRVTGIDAEELRRRLEALIS